jgi:hypothetical protein
MVKLSYLILEDCTTFCWSVFLKEMSELKDLIFTLTDLKIAGTDIEFIRCVDSGKPSYDCCANEYNINFELPGPRFPQHNGKVERKFQTFYGRISAKLNNTRLKYSKRFGVQEPFQHYFDKNEGGVPLSAISR